MSLRVATADDAEALHGLHAAAFDSPWTAQDIERLMRVLGGFAILAEDQAPQGFILARVIADEAEILTLAVAPSFRRRGIGRALVEAAAAEAARRRARNLFLEVADDNAAAAALYGAAGFARVGLRRAYYARPGARAADAFVLRRPLNSGDA